MRKLIFRFLYILVGVVLLIVAAAIIVGRDNLLTKAFGPVERAPVEFSKLSLSASPNRFLACPANYCAASPGKISPNFDVSVSELRTRWQKMIKAQPRVTELGVSNDKLQFDYVQRSALFSFLDTITVRFIPLGDSGSTVAIYSRSHYGRKDMGVNRNRVEQWLSSLSQSE
jgi:uncharacterized protein (DUF1499 family)